MNVDTITLAKQGDSTIIILIVVIVASMFALLPVMKLWVATKQTVRQQEIAQQDKFIRVIQGNTEVNVALKRLLEEDRRVCGDCRKEQQLMFRQLQDNQDVANIKLTDIHNVVLKKEGA